MYNELLNAQKLNREQLKGITAEEIIKLEIEDDRLSEQDKKSKAEQADVFYKNNFDKTLKLMTFAQLERLGNEAETEGQILFLRGVISGLSVVDEWFKKQVGIAHPEKEEEEEKEETIPNIGG